MTPIRTTQLIINKLRMKRLPILLIAILSVLRVTADEGMWIPMLIGKNIADMQKNGFKLTAEDLYSVNKSSLKDAIVLFGRGCTGELISNQGLLITNHHCGYGSIQSLSSVDHDYLSNGFWAMNRTEELPCPGLTVSFLVRMENVTEQVLKDVPEGCTEEIRNSFIKMSSDEIIKKVEAEGVGYYASIKPLYYGNEYYLYLYQKFSDIRFVGAPPESIGKFGGDTDNWVWPRHTGDFSMFRIYADKDNNPASYSTSNVPYTPKKFLNISTKELKENDFTLVYGFPGSTQQFITSDAVDLIVNQSNPHRINLRNVRLAIFDKYMQVNDTIRIQYSSKHASVANAWKKWIGESLGLRRLEASTQKREMENMFQAWANSTQQNRVEYGDLLKSFNRLYTELAPLSLVVDYSREAINAVELIQLSRSYDALINKSLDPKSTPEEVAKILNRTINYTRGFYKNFNINIDLEVMATMLHAYSEQIPANFQPAFMASINKENPNEWLQLAHSIYSQSVFADTLGIMTLLSDFDSTTARHLAEDNLYQVHSEFEHIFANKVYGRYYQIQDSLNILYRKYVQGLMQFEANKNFFPDANLTLRITYGKIKGFEPKDGVVYTPFTTIDGIAEKSTMTNVPDYRPPQKLMELYNNKDYGKHAVNGTIPVAFIATNHTTGGNSGSPMIDANGNLIGLNFDRCWESTMSDVMYDPNFCRNIALDIRYVLFIIDKFANAQHLIDEMVIVD